MHHNGTYDSVETASLRKILRDAVSTESYVRMVLELNTKIRSVNQMAGFFSTFISQKLLHV